MLLKLQNYLPEKGGYSSVIKPKYTPTRVDQRIVPVLKSWKPDGYLPVNRTAKNAIILSISDQILTNARTKKIGIPI